METEFISLDVGEANETSFKSSLCHILNLFAIWLWGLKHEPQMSERYSHNDKLEKSFKWRSLRYAAVMLGMYKGMHSSCQLYQIVKKQALKIIEHISCSLPMA